jgi:hypothetical protein
MPSSTLPRMTKATSEIAMKPMAPPGMAFIALARSCEKPDCVRPQAMAVAQPTMKMMAPVSDAVSTSIGFRRLTSNWRWMNTPTSTE